MGLFPFISFDRVGKGFHFHRRLACRPIRDVLPQLCEFEVIRVALSCEYALMAHDLGRKVQVLGPPLVSHAERVPKGMGRHSFRDLALKHPLSEDFSHAVRGEPGTFLSIGIRRPVVLRQKQRLGIPELSARRRQVPMQGCFNLSEDRDQAFLVAFAFPHVEDRLPVHLDQVGTVESGEF